MHTYMYMSTRNISLSYVTVTLRCSRSSWPLLLVTRWIRCLEELYQNFCASHLFSFFFGFGFVFGFLLAVDKIIFLLTDLSRYLVFKFKKPQNLSVWFQQLLYLSAGLWVYRYVCEVVAHNLLVEGIKAFIFVPYLLL